MKLIEQIIKCSQLGISIAFRPNTKTKQTEVILSDTVIGSFEKFMVTHELLEHGSDVVGLTIQDCIKQIMNRRYAGGTGGIKELG